MRQNGAPIVGRQRLSSHKCALINLTLHASFVTAWHFVVCVALMVGWPRERSHATLP